MAEKIYPKCSVCDTVDSLMWRQIGGEISSSGTPAIPAGQICHDCYQKTTKYGCNEEEKRLKTTEEKKLRKSTRISKKLKPTTATTIPSGGGGGANAAGGAGVGGKAGVKGGKTKKPGQKRNFKLPSIQSPLKYVTSVTHKGSKIKVGDIVSLMDTHDNLFYAQVRGLTVDMYCDKHAYITWLIPTQSSPPPNERFDASTYLIGHDEDTPRSLNLLEFVMHAPSSYYHDKAQPLPLEERPTGFTWTRHKRGAPPPPATATCTVTSGTAAAQNIVTTTTATVTISTPAENVTETSAVPVTDNGAVTSTTTTTTTAVAADSSTASEQ